MCLYWGVVPLSGAPNEDAEKLLAFIVSRGKRDGTLESGDRLVLLGGTELPGMHHNAIKVHDVW